MPDDKMKPYRRMTAMERLNLTPEQFAQRIRDYRFGNRMSLLEVGDVLDGVGASTIWRWEHGKSLPRSKIVIGKLMREHII